MASEGSTLALIKKRDERISLMPPPPLKHIKRPTEVLDEDDYTSQLSNIIARDYYPGLIEVKAQEEYLAALDSKNVAWMRESKSRLGRPATSEQADKTHRTTWDSQLPGSAINHRAQDTPVNVPAGGTPLHTIDATHQGNVAPATSKLPNDISLSTFQSTYTSEDNASFNDLLDKQNLKRKRDHSYMWTTDQRILSERLVQQRRSQALVLKQKQEYEEENSKELVAISAGATAERPARPSSWKVTNPTNNLMFLPAESHDESGGRTVQQLKEEISKAGPKTIIYENTRFPRTGPRYSGEDEDDSSSIHTSFIMRKNTRAGTDIITEGGQGGETPRVNGYSYVDEEEEPPPFETTAQAPSYRDLLAGQTPDINDTFRIRETQKREDLHRRLVANDMEKHRQREKDRTPVRGSGIEAGGMTPAGHRLADMLGGNAKSRARVKEEGVDWTPARTPRRQGKAVVT